MKISAIVHVAEEGGFWAEVPALPGCVAQSETREELEIHLHEAIEGWLLAGQPEATSPSGEIVELAV